jgi:hypothetical protein
MFEVLHTLSAKTIVRGLLRTYGVTVARLDYHKPDGCIYLTAIARGKVRHIPLPASQPMTADEIVELLCGEPAMAHQPACPATSADPPPP